jgi:hypothetical protein
VRGLRPLLPSVVVPLNLGTVGAAQHRVLRLLSWVTGAVLAVAGWFAVAVTPSAQAATSPEFFGTNLQPLQQNSSLPEERWGSFLQPLSTGRMTIHRIQADWFIVEPKAPVGGVHSWQWNAGGGRSSMDWTIAQLASRGLRAVPTLNNSPTWARGSGSNLPDASFDAFANFATAYIQRYGVGGTFWAEHPELPQLPATHFELWNEANSTNFWTGKPDAAAYARFLKAVYPKVKAAAPHAVLMPSIGWPDAANYLGQLASNGAAPFMDAVAFHPYAPTARAMFSLVAALRGTLASIGRADLPVWITESGQPANYVGTGMLHAYDGAVNDVARAATQSLAAEALAHSDCAVQSFLVYAVTGSETSREILSEGFMGVLRYSDGVPNATGLALQRASQRWVGVAGGTAPDRGRLVMCGQGATAADALLSLSLSAARGSSGGCVAGVAAFDGNPLEEATLVVETPDGRVARNFTNAAGATESCVPDGPKIDAVETYAEVPNVGRSPRLRCDIPVTSCTAVRTATPSNPQCTVVASASVPVRDRRGAGASVRVRAQLRCDPFKSSRSVTVRVRRRGLTASGHPRYRTKVVRRVVQPRFVVAFRRTGSGRDTPIRTVTLLHGRTVRFTVHRTMRRGDQLVFAHRANPRRDRLPAVRVSVPLRRPVPVRRAH